MAKESAIIVLRRVIFPYLDTPIVKICKFSKCKFLSFPFLGVPPTRFRFSTITPLSVDYDEHRTAALFSLHITLRFALIYRQK